MFNTPLFKVERFNNFTERVRHIHGNDDGPCDIYSDEDVKRWIENDFKGITKKMGIPIRKCTPDKLKWHKGKEFKESGFSFDTSTWFPETYEYYKNYQLARYSLSRDAEFCLTCEYPKEECLYETQCEIIGKCNCK